MKFRSALILFAILTVILCACATSPAPVPTPVPAATEPADNHSSAPKLECLSRESGTGTFTVKDINTDNGSVFTYTGEVGPGNKTSTNISKGEHLLGYNLGDKVFLYLAQSEVVSQTDLTSPCTMTRWQSITLKSDAEIVMTGLTK